MCRCLRVGKKKLREDRKIKCLFNCVLLECVCIHFKNIFLLCIVVRLYELIPFQIKHVHFVFHKGNRFFNFYSFKKIYPKLIYCRKYHVAFTFENKIFSQKNYKVDCIMATVIDAVQ